MRALHTSRCIKCGCTVRILILGRGSSGNNIEAFQSVRDNPVRSGFGSVTKDDIGVCLTFCLQIDSATAVVINEVSNRSQAGAVTATNADGPGKVVFIM